VAKKNRILKATKPQSHNLLGVEESHSALVAKKNRILKATKPQSHNLLGVEEPHSVLVP
jgi:hypothetical protein